MPVSVLAFAFIGRMTVISNVGDKRLAVSRDGTRSSPCLSTWGAVQTQPHGDLSLIIACFAINTITCGKFYISLQKEAGVLMFL